MIILDFNLDEETVNRLKGMLGNMSGGSKASYNTTSKQERNSKAGQSPLNLDGFDFNNSDFGNIDFETIMKAQSLMKKLNDKKGDNRSKLLKSLKPYMRDSRKEEIDKYSKMLRIADLLEFLNIENDEEKKHDK